MQQHVTQDAAQGVVRVVVRRGVFDRLDRMAGLETFWVAEADGRYSTFRDPADILLVCAGGAGARPRAARVRSGPIIGNTSLETNARNRT